MLGTGTPPTGKGSLLKPLLFQVVLAATVLVLTTNIALLHSDAVLPAIINKNNGRWGPTELDRANECFAALVTCLTRLPY